MTTEPDTAPEPDDGPADATLEEVLAGMDREELRDRARADGLTVSGTVEELRERIAAHEEPTGADAQQEADDAAGPETSPEGSDNEPHTYRAGFNGMLDSKTPIARGALFTATADHPLVKAGATRVEEDQPTAEQAAALAAATDES